MNATEPFFGLPAFCHSSSTLSLIFSYMSDSDGRLKPFMADVRLVQQTSDRGPTEEPGSCLHLSRSYFQGGIQ